MSANGYVISVSSARNGNGQFNVYVNGFLFTEKKDINDALQTARTINLAMSFVGVPVGYSNETASQVRAHFGTL